MSESSRREHLRELIAQRAADVEREYVAFAEVFADQNNRRRVDESIGIRESIERHDDLDTIVHIMINNFRSPQCVGGRFAIGA